MVISMTSHATPLLPSYGLGGGVVGGFSCYNNGNSSTSNTVTLERRSAAVSAGRRYVTGNNALRVSLAQHQHPATGKRAQSTTALRRDSSQSNETPTSESGMSRNSSYNVLSAMSAARKIRKKFLPKIANKEGPIEKPLKKMKRLTRLLILALRWASIVNERARYQREKTARGAYRSYTDHQSEMLQLLAINEKESGNITFRKDHYKANKELHLTNEVKRVLSLPIEKRTDHQISMARFGLQYLKTFSAYPREMQERMCRCGTFQRYQARRVIVRQFQVAMNFYFIIHGEVIIEIEEFVNGKRVVTTASIIGKDQCFGERAFLHKTRRTATVISKTDVQLLTISGEDFQSIFMSNEDSKACLPYHLEFMSTLDFMKGWPIQNLVNNREECLYNSFKPGSLVELNSNSSKFIYVIVSGSCRIMKNVSHQARRRSSASKQDFTNLHEGIHATVSKIDNGTPKVDRSKVCPELRQLMFEYSNTRINEDTVCHLRKSNDSFGNMIMSNESKVEDISTPQNCKSNARFIRSKSNEELLKQINDNDLSSITNKCIYGGADELKCQVPNSKSSYESFKISSKKSLKEFDQLINQQVDESNIISSNFIEVATLKKKDVFGLSTVRFNNQIAPKKEPLSFSLVSNGCECIMLSKKLFIQKADEKVADNVRSIQRSKVNFIDPIQLQTDVEKQVTWHRQKRKLMEKCIRDLNERRHIKKITIPCTAY